MTCSRTGHEWLQALLAYPLSDRTAPINSGVAVGDALMKNEEWAQVVAERAAKRESEARRKARPGYIYLLTHPDLPGYFKPGTPPSTHRRG